MFTSTPHRRVVVPLILATLLLLVSGCGIFSPDESKDTPPDPGGGEFVASTTPDLLMQNFRRAWEQMTIVEYEKLLADNFEFFFDPADNLDDFVGGPSWDRTKELTSATNMFSNQPGTDLTKDPPTPIPPILSIEFTTFSKITDWTNPPDGEIYRDTIRARYKVSIRVTYQGEANAGFVTGDNDFYAIKRNVDGQDLYFIKVWEDKGKNQG